MIEVISRIVQMIDFPDGKKARFAWVWPPKYDEATSYLP